MENKETRSALFTARDAEEALVRFTLILFAILVGILKTKRPCQDPFCASLDPLAA